MARASAARRRICRDAARRGSRLGDHEVVATDAAAFLKVFTIERLLLLSAARTAGDPHAGAAAAFLHDQDPYQTLKGNCSVFQISGGTNAMRSRNAALKINLSGWQL